MPAPKFALLPPAADLAGWAAAQILELHADARPDLTRVTVVLPPPAIGAFRTSLLRAAKGALLGPNLTTLADFALHRGADAAPLTALECRLLIVDALRRHRALFEGQDPWRVAEALFELFEEMTSSGLAPPGGEPEFQRRLAEAYGAPDLAALSLEARRVYVLWRAFQEDTGGRSPASVYSRALERALTRLAPGEHVYVVGLDRLTVTEAAALTPALAGGRIHVWLQGRIAGRDGAAIADLCSRLQSAPQLVAADAGACSALLDGVYADGEPPLLERARAASSAGAPEIRTVRASGPEHEARCVELAVRSAWLDGAREIAIIAPDRRLARRVRALLERAGLPLKDQNGWALSTSRAAASLACWLDCVQRDFHFRPLLDLLKSGFLDLPDGAGDAVRHFERHVVFGERIESGLRRYLLYADRIDGFPALLKQLAGAARLVPDGSRARPLADWISGIIRSAEALGLWNRWQSDPAGRRLAGELDALMRAARSQPLACDAAEFRALLDRALEQATFVPESRQHAGIRLLTLEQSALLKCDALVLSGATRAGLPGAPHADPFFSDAVRSQFGLSTWEKHRALGLARFRRVLEAAPRIWITYAPASADEAALPSPWLEALESFCAAAGLGSLRDDVLAARAGSAAVEISRSEEPRPGPQRRPRPAMPAQLMPTRFSATRHQRLVDCPYQFYTRHGLGLQRPEDPDQDPDARDYGKHLHQILQAFHEQVEGLPPPFSGPVTPATRAEAEEKLRELADAVFAADLERRVLAATWRERFHASVPLIAEWMAERAADWPHVAAEADLERELEPPFVIEGRADRLERNAAGDLCVVDYKSGGAIDARDVGSGELVQLVHYALLDDRARQVEYWQFKDGRRQVHDGDALRALQEAVLQRLENTLRALRAGAPMPAHGDGKTCERCDYAGICRRNAWEQHEDGR